MNYKHNLNYFKSGDGLKNLGLVLAIVGGLVFYFGWSYISYVLSCMAIPAGLFLFFWSTGRRSSDQDIDENIREACEGVKIPWEDSKELTSRRRNNVELLIAEGYEYEEGLMFAKAKNGEVRSSQYTKAEIGVLKDALYVIYKSFSLVSEDSREQTEEIPLKEIQSIRLVEEEKELTFEKNTFHVTVRKIVLKYGEKELSFPVQNDLRVEQFIERINDLRDRKNDPS